MTAPDFFITSSFTRSGPALRRVNPKAISFVIAQGGHFEDVYPEGVAELRSIAPTLMEGGRVSDAAKDFASEAGLPFGVLYPEHADAIVLRSPPEAKRSKWRVAGAVLGFAAGACLVGPLGAAVGAVAAWAAGGRLT